MAKFVNPYNFVPFGDGTITKYTREEKYRGDEELISGWLDVSLYTKTPIIIPDGTHVKYINPETHEEIHNPTEEQKKKLHKKLMFMKRNGKYILPGSEIRGLIRSVYEAATNSCVRELMDENPISQRVPTFSSLNKRGLLGFEKGKWVLYSTDKTVVRKFSPKNKNDAGIFKDNIKKWPEPTGKNYNDGTVLQYNIPVSISAPTPYNKKGQSYTIYKLKKKNLIYQWDIGDKWPYKKLKSSLMRDGVSGSDPNGKCHKELLSLLERTKSGTGEFVPVYYFVVERESKEEGKNVKIVYLSGSAIGRIGNYRKWEDAFGVYSPCKGPDYCPACLLFGTMKQGGLKSHIRVTDAFTEEYVKGINRTLDILGMPRQTAFEFYYEKPDNQAKYWNIDFYSSQNRRNEPTTFYDLKDATPRGRKMYWHSNPKDTNAKMSNMNSTMETVKTHSPFTFKIYFDQITKGQLEDLEWVITLGDNSVDSNLQHKLGHAKPLGYGSVKLVIDNVCLRKINAQNNQLNYVIDKMKYKAIDNTTDIKLESDTVKSICAMADVKKTNEKKVAYPHLVNKKGDSDAIFNWFTDNRKNANTVKVLPKPTDECIELEGSWLNDSTRKK